MAGLLKRDLGLPVSALFHAALLAMAVIVWPNTEPLPPAEESLPVQVVTSQEFAQITKGEKTAKQADKPLTKVDKVAPDDTPPDDNPATEIKHDATAAAQPSAPPTPPVRDVPPDPPVKPDLPTPDVAKADPTPDPPTPVAKPVPKPVAKQEPKPDTKPDVKPIPKEDSQKLDDLALKAAEDTTPDKPVAKPVKPVDKPVKTADATPPDKPDDTPPKPPAKAAPSKPAAQSKPATPSKSSQTPPDKDRTFDPSNIAALLSKEKPSRTERSGKEVATTSSLGSAIGTAPKLSLSERSAIQGMVMDHVKPCWNPPSYAADASSLAVLIDVDLNPDGTLAAEPQIKQYPARGAAAAAAAIRALKRCVTAQSPLKLPPNLYGSWRALEVNFDPRDAAGL